MVTFTTLSTTFESWAAADQLMTNKALEDSARTGVNTWLTSLHQLGQTASLFTQYTKFLEVQQKTQEYFLGWVVAFSLPMGVGIADASIKVFGLKPDPLVQKSIVWLQDNIGSLCQIASIVTSLAFIHIGYTAYGVTSLAVLGIGYLGRNQLLPLEVQQAYSYVGPWVSDVGNILFSPWLLKLFVLPDFTDKIYNLVFQDHQIPYAEAQHPSHLTTFQDFQDIYRERAEVEVNRDHVWIAPFPHVANPNFDSLIGFCNGFVWPIDSLERSLAHDARWFRAPEKALSEAPGIDKRALEILYAKNSFNSMVASVRDRTINTGQLLDYGILQNYLGYIAEKLPLASKDLQEQIMIQLAVEGGDYCGPGIYYQLETAATTLLLNQQAAMGGRQRLPFKQRILFVLQQERMRVMEGLHDILARINPGVHFWNGGRGDIHSMNHTIQLLGYQFGLPDQGANQDETAKKPILFKWYVHGTTGVRPKDLWSETKDRRGTTVEGYTVNRLLGAYKAQAGLPIIQNADVYDWARNWIEQFPDQKAAFLERLGDGGFEGFNASMKDAFIKAMLVDMGILQIKKRA